MNFAQAAAAAAPAAPQEEAPLRVYRVTVAVGCTVEAADPQYARMVAALVLGLAELPPDAIVTEVLP